MRSKFCFAVVAIVLVLGSAGARADEGVLPPRSAIKMDRPRLLVRPHATQLAIPLTALRAQPQGADFKAMLDKLKSQDDAAAQAMVWLLNRDPAAAERAVKRMRAYRMPAKPDTFEAWFRLQEFALAYDWLYDAPGFDKTVRAEVRTNVAPLAAAAIRLGDDHVFHNYTWMSSSGLLMWALSTAGEDDASNQLYETARTRFNDRLFPTLRYLEGLPSEPMGYWSFYVFTPSVLTVLAAQSATETDVVADIRANHGNWLERDLESLIQFTLPDLRYVPWGDLQEGSHGGVTQEMAGIIDAATWGLHSAQGRWFGHRIAEKRGLSRFLGETAVFYMLYTRTLDAQSPAAPAPAAPPLSYLGGGQQGGEFVARSDWDPGQTVVGFRCADFMGNHHHYDQGSFLIYRRGLLAVDPPVYHKVGGPQHETAVHNALLIGGHPQRAAQGQSFNTLERFRENLKAGKHLETGDLPFEHDAGAWAAVAGQYAQAYDEPALQSCVRQLLFIRPATVIVVDRLVAKPGKELPQVQWLLQLPAAPHEDATGLVASNGQSWLRCRPILPGPSKPTIAATPVNTQCATFTYPGKAEVTLVHVLDTGDGAEPKPPVAVHATRTARGIEVSAGNETFLFDTEAPYKVAAGAAGKAPK